MYENIVISGGGHTIFQYVGVMHYCLKNNIIDKEKIKSIYSTSAGSIIAILLSLITDWDICSKYFIERPWMNLFNIEPLDSLYSLYKNKGIFDITQFTSIFKPFFNSQNINIDITLSEFYSLTNIEIYFYSLEIQTFEIKEISYKNSPDMKLIDASYISSALPILFSPYYKEDLCYIDGGIFKNYPIYDCLNRVDDKSTVLGIRKIMSDEIKNNNNSDCNAFEYIFHIIYQLVKKIKNNNLDDEYKDTKEIKEIKCNSTRMSYNEIIKILKCKDEREKLYNEGYNYAKDVFNKENEEKI